VIHYHCADINPNDKLLELEGRHLLVSHAYPRPVNWAHSVAQSVVLDNGAFSVWRSGKVADWKSYYVWSDYWLDCPTTWAIIPDVIDGGSEANDQLIRDWPHGNKGSPVWHLDEPLDRLYKLVDDWWRVCLGSAGAFDKVGSAIWHSRMVEVFNGCARRGRMPELHGLRMQAHGGLYPFYSVDSANIARNNHRPQNTISGMAERIDRVQPPPRWVDHLQQQELII